MYETRDHYLMRPRPRPRPNETETETKKVVSRPHWSRDLNIPEVIAILNWEGGLWGYKQPQMDLGAPRTQRTYWYKRVPSCCVTGLNQLTPDYI